MLKGLGLRRSLLLELGRGLLAVACGVRVCFGRIERRTRISRRRLCLGAAGCGRLDMRLLRLRLGSKVGMVAAKGQKLLLGTVSRLCLMMAWSLRRRYDARVLLRLGDGRVHGS